MSDDKTKFDPEMLAIIKEQVITEMKDEQTRKMEESVIERKKQQEDHDAYVEKMKTSTEPWVDIVCWTETDKGVKVDLDWNDAFVDYLKANGVTGADDDQVIQKYITLLLRDSADQMEDQHEGEYE